MNNPEDRLRADLERLAQRVYSEEGVPMLLACEDLAPDRPRRDLEAVTLTPLNETVASGFSRDVEVWQRLWPEAAVNDVVKVIEILADRDFTAGGSAPEL